ncbi:bifunctional nicotinamidase/pyrazinamidase [Legionella londiniensis]|uniref:nicotinamidase n=1 Tax=Legionella londiniensis TaxID=45068 RepID=A0A0W0VND9_9GAMM|nr:bifunctional nicotinamidase/pyrazinamidase [Legionella londiniensis]KTD21607.1 bifunctional pyrazinamidase/nicotinamidase [Legionella londiniensis]STX93378.1 bifunctional pyrazinamidase/nicotinamidase [Legionella londiniensis]
MKTLILIDVQNDFMPEGPLEVSEGNAIIPVINQIAPKFDLVIATQDWHPANHMSFASNHKNKKPFDTLRMNGQEQILWPDHCVQGSYGAEFHAKLDVKPIEAIFRKGVDPEIDSYSCFYENDHKTSIGLAGFLREKKASELYFCGLAADVCVYYSIKDAIKEGFRCFLIDDAVRPLSKENYQKIKNELVQKDVHIINSSDL